MAEKSRRGFASMDRAKQREIASKGGKAAHAKGIAHTFTPEEAREAGRKGGKIAQQRGTAHRFTPEEARRASLRSSRNRRKPQPAPSAGLDANPTFPARQPQTNGNMASLATSAKTDGSAGQVCPVEPQAQNA